MHEFLNNLRILHSIDSHELGDPAWWIRFRDDPVHFLLRCDDERAGLIWQAIERRQPKRGMYSDVVEANARLIAAAPDLLSVARQWVELDGRAAWHQERRALEKADLLVDTKQAIAKAEGR